ncbi:MAG: T9SS type A sorting domain-containing protein, partial [Flavobacteriaceae bacterium]|nr:T9SS type A sorting domain-containing protein [Flavobacteriaceae bacterium]
ANSYDGGATWEDFRVSDVAFTPQPISGLAGGYMGDYLGISARGGIVYPVWPDNRNGYVQAFVSPYETNTRVKPEDLVVVLTNDVTGQTDLTWTFAGSPSFQNFVVYRDGSQIDTTTDQFYTDMLPDFGLYSYTVTAMHDDGESSGISGTVQWGNPLISVDPTSLEETLVPDDTSVQTLTITNTGQLDLIYNIETDITNSPEPVLPICDASGGGGDEFISRVQFGDIDNASAQTFYGDYTNLSTDVEAGATYPITITNGEIFASDDLGIWIDINQDEDFDDPGEEVLCTVDDGANGTYNITIPSDALGGTTRMRIRIKFNGADCGNPCGTTTWGEVEDYSINVNSWLQVDTSDGIIAPGDSEIINVNFDSTGLALGDYFASIFVGSNASNSPLIEVPVTLHVVDSNILQTTATTDDAEVCVGTSTVLHANPNGGSGSYTYSWTSVPAGFSSTLENPTVSPLVNTVYTVVVDDGVDSVSSSVSVDVVDIPAQANMPSGDEDLCQDADSNSYTTDTVANTTFYDWSIDPAAAGIITGTTTTASVDWDAAFSGNVTITVTANNDCGAGLESQALSVTINELPTVILAGFDDVCFDEPAFELTGGEPLGGTYSGVGVSGGFFDAADAGVGIHTITYAYSDAEGCENFATQNIEVNPLPTVTLAPYADVFDNDPPFTLTGGDPVGGEYSGPGVSGGIFDPAVAGVGIHIITYSYMDVNGCENFAMQTIEVIELIGVNDFENGINFILYPNPNNGLLNLELNSTIVNDFEVRIVNQIGAIIFMKQINVSDASEFAFDLSGLANGMYYFILNSDKQNYAEKILVNN